MTAREGRMTDNSSCSLPDNSVYPRYLTANSIQQRRPPAWATTRCERFWSECKRFNCNNMVYLFQCTPKESSTVYWTTHSITQIIWLKARGPMRRCSLMREDEKCCLVSNPLFGWVTWNTKNILSHHSCATEVNEPEYNRKMWCFYSMRCKQQVLCCKILKTFSCHSCFFELSTLKRRQTEGWAHKTG